ncbi:MAG TPA: hypothetical protein VE986_04315 [Hyphomicrobiales bacterium]|nr:hypothetical protein [Hyphomicrobiales bacterium]
MKAGLFSPKERTAGTLLPSVVVVLAVWQWDCLDPYAALVLSLDAAPVQTIAELTLEAKIRLGAVKGRIDHLAFDPGRVYRPTETALGSAG